MYQNNASSGEIVVTFCDSTVWGKFIGSPNHNPFDLHFHPPVFDGSFSGVQQNQEWVGKWRDNRFTGSFVVKFSEDYTKFQGKFTREQNGLEWQEIYGDEKDEWLTVEGRRSVVWSGIASFFAPGYGQYYNREYNKFIIYRAVHALGGASVISGAFVSFVSIIQSLSQPYPQPTIPGQMMPSQTTYNDPQATGRIGTILFFGGASVVAATMITSCVDAVISAQRINTEMDTQPSYQCQNPSILEDMRFGVELGVANAVYLPQLSLNLAVHIPLYKP